MNNIAFIDLEIDGRGKIVDAGAVKAGKSIHTSRIAEFVAFISDADYLCGHNIIEHDCKYLKSFLPKDYALIDTLYLSPLLFPRKPYHRLLKDDKLLSDELNNPLNDALKAKELIEDEVNAFNNIDKRMQQIYYELTASDIHFKGFFDQVGYSPDWRPFFLKKSTADSVKEVLAGKICANADVNAAVKNSKIETAYSIALI